MSTKNAELVAIATKFAESGWDLIDAPSRAWLEAEDETLAKASHDLIAAVEEADESCGSCGCEYDPLYKRALVLLRG